MKRRFPRGVDASAWVGHEEHKRQSIPLVCELHNEREHKTPIQPMRWMADPGEKKLPGWHLDGLDRIRRPTTQGKHGFFIGEFLSVGKGTDERDRPDVVIGNERRKVERCQAGMEATQTYAKRVQELFEAAARHEEDPEGVEKAGKRYAEAREAVRDACVAPIQATSEPTALVAKKRALQQELAKKRDDMKCILEELRALDAQLVMWNDSRPSLSAGCDANKPP